MMKIFAIAVTLLLSFTSHAGIRLVPYLGVTSGNLKTTSVADFTATASYSGVSYGLDLISAFSSTFVALDVRGFSGSDDATPSSAKLARMDFGLKFGFMFGKNNEIYGEYIAKQDLKITYTSSDLTLSGTGFRFGFAHTNDKKIKVGVDISSYTYSTYQSSDGTSGDLSTFYKTVIDVPVTLTIGYAF